MMADEPQGNVQKEEDLAMKDTADENAKHIQNEYQDNDDEVVLPQSDFKASAAPSQSKVAADVKPKAAEMNIKLQR
jgi:hypothetical protein